MGSAAIRGACFSALREAGRGEVVEAHQPGRCELFHSPWIDGALLNSPVPMVVTVHDVVPLKRVGEYCGWACASLQCLAVQRAARVIVPTRAVADDTMRTLEIPAERIAVVGMAAAPTLHKRTDQEVAKVRNGFELPEQFLLWVGPLEPPEPRKRIAALAGAKRTMPLVLVGAHR